MNKKAKQRFVGLVLTGSLVMASMVPAVAFGEKNGNVKKEVAKHIKNIKDVRDKREDVRDKKEDIRDKREDIRDKREDIRDRIEDIKDRRDGITGKEDLIEDIKDKKEDIRDRVEDIRDKKEDVRDRIEDIKDKKEDLNGEKKVKAHLMVQDLKEKLKYLENNKKDLIEKRANKEIRNTIIEIMKDKKQLEKMKKEMVKEEAKNLKDKALELAKEGDIDEAIALYKDVLKVDKTDREVYRSIGRLLEKKGYNKPKVFVKGKMPEFDVLPKIKDNRTLVPLRGIAEALDAKVEWDSEKNAVVMKKDGKIIILPIGSDTITIDGKEVKIDVPAEIDSGRTFVPVRVVSETLETNVDWDGETQTITVDEMPEEETVIEEDINVDDMTTEEILEIVENTDLIEEFDVDESDMIDEDMNTVTEETSL